MYSDFYVRQYYPVIIIWIRWNTQSRICWSTWLFFLYYVSGCVVHSLVSFALSTLIMRGGGGLYTFWLWVGRRGYIYFLIVCRGRGYIYFSFVWYLIFIFTHHTILLQHTTWTVHTVGVASTYNIEQWYVYKYMSEDFTQQCWKYMFLLTVFGTYTFNKTHHLFAYQNEEHFSSPRRRPPQ